MQITKDTLPQINYITLYLNYGYEYDIDCKDIIDICFDDIQTQKCVYNYIDYREAELYATHNGRIILSKSIFDQTSKNLYYKDDDGTMRLSDIPIEYHYFANRILKACDISQIKIYFKDGTNVSLSTDCDPLYSNLHGYEIEYSNCPSVELDENGDMLILFGKSSKALKRIDNDYYNVIENINTFLPKKSDNIFSVIVNSCDNGGEEAFSPDNGLYIDMDIQNDEYKNKNLPLVFYDVEKLTFDFNFTYIRENDFLISTAENGKYFVQIGDKCNFFCKKIKVFYYFDR